MTDFIHREEKISTPDTHAAIMLWFRPTAGISRPGISPTFSKVRWKALMKIVEKVEGPNKKILRKMVDEYSALLL